MSGKLVIACELPAATAMTVESNAVAISVSQSSGAVRVWKSGQAVLELQQVARRS